MGERGKVTDVSKQATCKVCGLTARTKDELEIHIRQAHGTANSDKSSSEQKIDPFPWGITCYVLLTISPNSRDHLFIVKIINILNLPYLRRKSQ